MSDTFTVAVTGDAIINRRVSVLTDKRFLSLVGILREADVAYTHLETIIHDYDGPEVYPSATAGWTWMRSPNYVADELKWMGFDIVSHASNHSLDYCYGGLTCTWDVLSKAGLPYAGTGRDLGEARAPAYLDTGKARVALISMCSSFSNWARAAYSRRDMKGRPGLNPLRFHYAVDPATMETLKHLGEQFGWWVRAVGDTWLINRAGSHNAVQKFVLSDKPGVHVVVDEDDAEDNIRSIRDARRQADYVLVHLHSHEWDPQGGLSRPAEFVPPFARACIDAGADIFIAEGSHAPLRGIELYEGRPIFYDPGDFIGMSQTVTKLPTDFYWRAGYAAEARNWEARTSDAFAARAALPAAWSPSKGYYSAPVSGAVIAVCSFDTGRKLVELKLHPATLLHEPRPRAGLPLAADAETAKKMIAYLGELSAPFGTRIDFKDGAGQVRL